MSRGTFPPEASMMLTFGFCRTRAEPVIHLLHFLPDERLVMEGTGQRCDALTAGEKMHGPRVRFVLASEQSELPAQPRAKQSEQLFRFALRGVTELRKLGAQRAYRATIALDVGAVGNQDVNEAANSIGGSLSFDLPPFQHLARCGQTRLDDGIQDLILRFEVVVEVAARDPYGLGNVR